MSERFYRRSLPHWHAPEATYFVTYRLYGSIPQAVLRQIHANYLAEITRQDTLKDSLSEAAMHGSPHEYIESHELRQQIAQVLKTKRYEALKRHFKSYDDFLDSNLNAPYWLRNEQVARLNADALHFYDGKKYHLQAFCLMPNHVHLLCHLLPQSSALSTVLQDLKRYTALHSNRLLGRTGRFWEKESYDHLVRAGEAERIVAYILNNPVKAGWVKHWANWKWTYCSPELQP